MNEDKTIRISEIFGPTIQGEGALIGRPTIFVRTGGCDYRCSWCDTLYAVDSEHRTSWKAMSAAEIMGEIERLSSGHPMMVTLSGGNPAIQPLEPLLKMGQDKGYRFSMETQGSIAQDWFKNLDGLTLSPKPPSSGMKTNWDLLSACMDAAGPKTQISLKIVVFDEADYTYARDVYTRYPDIAFYMQPGNHSAQDTADIEGLNTRMRWLIERASNDNWHNVTILPQLHVMLWGNIRGV